MKLSLFKIIFCCLLKSIVKEKRGDPKQDSPASQIEMAMRVNNVSIRFV